MIQEGSNLINLEELYSDTQQKEVFERQTFGGILPNKKVLAFFREDHKKLIKFEMNFLKFFPFETNNSVISQEKNENIIDLNIFPKFERQSNSSNKEDRKSPQFKVIEENLAEINNKIPSNLENSQKEPIKKLQDKKRQSNNESDFSDLSNISYELEKNKASSAKELNNSKMSNKPILLDSSRNFNFKKNDLTRSPKNDKNKQGRSLSPMVNNLGKPPIDLKKEKKINKINENPKNHKKKSSKSSSVHESSDEEPLHIKISLDLKKFNKEDEENAISKNRKSEENDNPLNSEFLRSVVKDIDKLTQKMLSTNNNLAGSTGLIIK